MNYAEVAQRHGGASALARKLGLTPTAVINWGVRGVPKSWQLAIRGMEAAEAFGEKGFDAIDAIDTPSGISRSDAYRQGVSDTVDKLVDAGIVDLRSVLLALVGEPK